MTKGVIPKSTSFSSRRIIYGVGLNSAARQRIKIVRRKIFEVFGYFRRFMTISALQSSMILVSNGRVGIVLVRAITVACFAIIFD